MPPIETRGPGVIDGLDEDDSDERTEFDILTVGMKPASMERDPMVSDEFVVKLFTALFAAVTTTPVAMLRSISPVDQDDYNLLVEEFESHPLGREGVEMVRRMTAITDERMPAYTWRGTIHARGGGDFLLMRDDYGHYVHSWPTSTRVVNHAETA